MLLTGLIHHPIHPFGTVAAPKPKKEVSHLDPKRIRFPFGPNRKRERENYGTQPKVVAMHALIMTVRES